MSNMAISKEFQTLRIYRLKPWSEKPTTSSRRYPALQNQNINSRGVISMDRSARTARKSPSMMTYEMEEKSCLYRGTLSLESLKREALDGSYRVTDLLAKVSVR